MSGPDGRLRTPAAILETASHVLAERGDASMNDIAAAAGVGRATLYRHFPTRDALMKALVEEATQDLVTRIRDAGLDGTPVAEALHRLLRAIFAVGDRYLVFTREFLTGGHAREYRPDKDVVDQFVAAPIRSVLERGVADGTLRTDLGAEAVVQLFGGLIVGALEGSLQRTLGVEAAAAAVASVFLYGAGRSDTMPQASGVS